MPMTDDDFYLIRKVIKQELSLFFSSDSTLLHRKIEKMAVEPRKVRLFAGLDKVLEKDCEQAGIRPGVRLREIVMKHYNYKPAVNGKGT